MLYKLKHSRKGFTLVELILAMAIMGIMSVMTLMIYFNISETSRRLQISREISETARQITERISQEVRENGIAFAMDDNQKFQYGTPGWKQNFYENYLEDPDLNKWKGGNVLPIGLFTPLDTNGTPQMKKDANGNDMPVMAAKKFFVYGKKDDTDALAPCDFNANDSDKKNVKCGLFLWEGGNSYNLVDAFRADEKDKRVRITDLKFYITGGPNDANKVTLKMTLELAPRVGVGDKLIGATKMEIQTTFSERPYKIK